MREGSWKLILAPGSGGKGKHDPAQPAQLYNLAEDLGETKNLAAEQPERVAQMQALLEKLITGGRSTRGATQANDVEVKRYPQPESKAKTRYPPEHCPSPAYEPAQPVSGCVVFFTACSSTLSPGHRNIALNS